MSEAMRIACGDSECTLVPGAGGSLESWRVGGQEMLRRAVDPANPLQCASFPLVPYSNRIGEARFRWEGEEVNLRPHAISHPHAIHGVGWQKPWEVSDLEADQVTLTLRHDGDEDWPWPLLAEQQISIGTDWLHILMTVWNLADGAVPLAFGHHPYFDSEGASLSFSAERFYPSGPDMLPLAAEAIDAETDFSHGRAVAGCRFDNGFGGWRGTARIEWNGRRYALGIESDMTDAVLYTPSGPGFFCFEPVPHQTNALNRADCAMPVVAPKEAFVSHIGFTAIPA